MKGFLKTFEAVIAIFMMAAFFIAVFATEEKIVDVDTINWKIIGFNALKALHDQDKLATPALSNDTATIESRLSSIIPSTLNYQVLICGDNCPTPSISSSKITTISFFVAGNASDINPKEVVLYIWA
jgi:hypothetical protein